MVGGGVCILSRLFKLLLYSLMKHVSMFRHCIPPSRDTLGFADTLCSLLFKDCELFKVESKPSEAWEVTSVTSHESVSQCESSCDDGGLCCLTLSTIVRQR